MKTRLLISVTTILLISGCSTLKQSILLGIGSGAAVGGASGAMMSQPYGGKHALQGTLIGAVVGGIAGFLVHRGLEARDDSTRKETLFNLNKFNVQTPLGKSSAPPGITRPVIESEWIETQVQNKKLIEGHRVWIISEDPEWILDQQTNSNLTKDKK